MSSRVVALGFAAAVLLAAALSVALTGGENRTAKTKESPAEASVSRAYQPLKGRAVSRVVGDGWWLGAGNADRPLFRDRTDARLALLYVSPTDGPRMTSGTAPPTPTSVISERRTASELAKLRRELPGRRTLGTRDGQRALVDPAGTVAYLIDAARDQLVIVTVPDAAQLRGAVAQLHRRED